MDDLISRQAAIELWEEYHPYIAVKACEYGKRLRSLPSAERRGRWVIKKDVTFPHTVCSECKKPFYGNIDEVWSYCPNCGARMEE